MSNRAAALLWNVPMIFELGGGCLDGKVWGCSAERLNGGAYFIRVVRLRHGVGAGGCFLNALRLCWRGGQGARDAEQSANEQQRSERETACFHNSPGRKGPISKVGGSGLGAGSGIKRTAHHVTDWDLMRDGV